MQFNVQDISKYRAHLMGIATLLVIFGHSAGNGVVMPGWMESLCGLASVGVDIFLLVSGLGLWYSLNNLKAERLSGGIETVVCKEIQENTCSVSDNYRISKNFVCDTWYADISGIVGTVNDRLLDKPSGCMVCRNAYTCLRRCSYSLLYLPEGKKSGVVYHGDNCSSCFGVGIELSYRESASTRDNC